MKLMILKGGLYVAIAFVQPYVDLLNSDQALSERALWAAGVAGFWQGLVTLKAWTSSSPGDMQNDAAIRSNH